jgi:hypothetical protein
MSVHISPTMDIKHSIRFKIATTQVKNHSIHTNLSREVQGPIRTHIFHTSYCKMNLLWDPNFAKQHATRLLLCRHQTHLSWPGRQVGQESTPGSDHVHCGHAAHPIAPCCSCNSPPATLSSLRSPDPRTKPPTHPKAGLPLGAGRVHRLHCPKKIELPSAYRRRR